MAEIRPGNGADDERQVAIVAVAKPANDVGREAKDSLILDKKLIWEQPDTFLDFALLPPSAGISPTLLILEPSRLNFYRPPDPQSGAQPGAQWQLWQSVTIAHPNPRSRDDGGAYRQRHAKGDFVRRGMRGRFSTTAIHEMRSVKPVARRPEGGNPRPRGKRDGRSRRQNAARKCSARHGKWRLDAAGFNSRI